MPSSISSESVTNSSELNSPSSVVRSMGAVMFCPYLSRVMSANRIRVKHLHPERAPRRADKTLDGLMRFVRAAIDVISELTKSIGHIAVVVLINTRPRNADDVENLIRPARQHNTHAKQAPHQPKPHVRVDVVLPRSVPQEAFRPPRDQLRAASPCHRYHLPTLNRAQPTRNSVSRSALSGERQGWGCPTPMLSGVAGSQQPLGTEERVFFSAESTVMP